MLMLGVNKHPIYAGIVKLLPKESSNRIFWEWLEKQVRHVFSSGPVYIFYFCIISLCRILEWLFAAVKCSFRCSVKSCVFLFPLFINSLFLSKNWRTCCTHFFWWCQQFSKFFFSGTLTAMDFISCDVTFHFLETLLVYGSRAASCTNEWSGPLPHLAELSEGQTIHYYSQMP